MLNIYYGRENIDKEKFIYEKIHQTKGRTLVIVPDQYTLEAEKQAFRFLKTQGLLDVEIISLSRLGSRLLTEEGGGRKTFIDKYGRHMLLSRIVREIGKDLQVFGGSVSRGSFLEMTNNFISEMKQYNIRPEMLAGLREGLPEKNLLYRKLEDLELIFSKYQEAIAGKYTDSEDLIDLYMEKIPQSQTIKNCSVWVYGFDSFAPKALSVLGYLMEYCKDFHIFFTHDKNCLDEDLFRLTEILMGKMISQAEVRGIPWRREQVNGATYKVLRPEAVGVIEQQLYAVQLTPQQDAAGLTVIEAGSIYGEAETAAAHVLHLLRDKGMRYRDIAIICNDQKVRGSIVSRVFEEYGIALFDDKKRSIISSPIAIFILTILEVIIGGYRTGDLCKVLKTGFTNLSSVEIETLENYALKYRIHGRKWKTPFVKGGLEYGEDGLKRIENLRQRAMLLFSPLEDICRHAKTIGEFVEQYYDYLLETAALDRGILHLIELQEEADCFDLAEETQQIWGKVVNLLDQITELIGDEPFDKKEFVQMLATGLSEMEVGVLPPTSDDILMGTMQRTRCGEMKALLIIGANEGLLPANTVDEGLFSLDELRFLAEEGTEICKVDQIRVWEERLAIYRNLSKPMEDLWISYSVSDEEGKETRPSEIVDTLKRIFPNLQMQKDVLNQQDAVNLIGGRICTLRHLTKALQDAAKGNKIDGVWEPVLEWFQQKDTEIFDRVSNGLAFTNQQQKLPAKLVELLYKRSDTEKMVLSPSRLEKFSRCPFAHFIAYGLRPEERRVFEAASREIGDLYHQCLMEVSEKLTAENQWYEVTEEQCRQMVREITRREGENYREGVFQFGSEEKYKLQRMEDTCFHVCWALIEQIRSGKVLESRYEAAFGRNEEIPPIAVKYGEEEILIEGKIDRVDFMDDDRVKIIDYKTGEEQFRVKEAIGGYRLQLMLYLKAAQQQEKKPAGVFYFLISEPRVDVTETEKEKYFEKISKEIRKSFRLNGIIVNDSKVIHGIAGDFKRFSDIVPLKKVDGEIRGNSDQVLLSEEDFGHLQEAVDRQVEKLCRQLVEGSIGLHPKKTEKTSACVRCDFHSICRFDTAFDDCKYEIIK